MHSQVRKVEAFMTTDDQVHLSPEEAGRHQAKLDLLKLVEAHGYRNMEPEHVADMLSEHAVEFLPLLTTLGKPTTP